MSLQNSFTPRCRCYTLKYKYKLHAFRSQIHCLWSYNLRVLIHPTMFLQMAFRGLTTLLLCTRQPNGSLYSPSYKKGRCQALICYFPFLATIFLSYSYLYIGTFCLLSVIINIANVQSLWLLFMVVVSSYSTYSTCLLFFILWIKLSKPFLVNLIPAVWNYKLVF